jgi:hypothetical protein
MVIGFAAAGALLVGVDLDVVVDEDFSDDALTIDGSRATAHSTRASVRALETSFSRIS